MAEQHRQNAQSCLEHRGLSPAAIAQVEWVDVPVDSVWIRDYGPEIVTGQGGERRLVDMSYYPQLSDTCNNLAGRTNDDASPTRLAAAWGGLPVDRAQVRLEGGNLQTDGAGTCFRARRNANARNCFSRWCYTEEELNEVIGAYHGCNVVALESMVGVPQGHHRRAGGGGPLHLPARAGPRVRPQRRARGAHPVRQPHPLPGLAALRDDDVPLKP